MGWSSSIVCYDTDDQRRSILNALEKHNTEPDFDLVGEDIVGVVQRTFKIRSKRRFPGPGQHAIVFGNSGGGRHTCHYLRLKGVIANDYSRDLEELFTDDIIRIELPSAKEDTVRGRTAPSVPVKDPETAWAMQLQALQDMGFKDHAANVAALQATNGCKHAAVEQLLS